MILSIPTLVLIAWVVWFLWLAVTGVGSYYCHRVMWHAFKDLEWTRASGKNGLLLTDAQHQFQLSQILLFQQIIGFALGVLLPLIEDRQMRGWLMLALVMLWSISTTFIAYRSLCNRRLQWKETLRRDQGHLRTRKDDRE